jgi:hypothetical protein
LDTAAGAGRSPAISGVAVPGGPRATVCARPSASEPLDHQIPRKERKNMGLIQFLDKNASAVFALCGVLLTLVVDLFRQWNERAYGRYLRRVELAIEIEKRIQFDPIAEFIESYLSLLQMTYAKGVNKDISATPEISDQSNMQLAAASARIKLYRDSKLSDMFNNFTRKRIEMGNSLFDERQRDLSRAYSLLTEAEATAAEILDTLRTKLLRSVT